MLQFEVTRQIAAPPDQVWARLTDAAELASGPYGILKLDGRIAEGERLKLWSQVAPERAFALKVSGVTPNRRMTWRGGMPLGLFTGTRTYTLEPAAGGTTFVMREVYSGLLAGLIGRTLPDLTPSFAMFGDALKIRCETR